MKNVRSILPPLLLALACIAPGARLQAAPMGPISITNAAILPQPPAEVNDNGVQYGYVGVNSLNVSFVNTAAVDARLITLRATYNGETKIIEDRGDFAPQVKVDRLYRTFANEEFRGDRVRVRVAEVRFADGTTWTSDSLKQRQ